MLPEGGAWLAGSGIEAHQRSMRFLAQGIDVDGPPRVVDRSLELPFALKVGDEPGEGLGQSVF